MTQKNALKASARMPGSTPVADIKRDRSWVLYGRSGSGKTTLAADFPKPMLYIDVKDEGTDSIADVKGIDVKSIEDSDDLEEVLLWLKKNKKAYKTVVIDTMTQVQDMIVAEVADRKKRKIKKGQQPGDFGTLQKQDWGEVSGRMKELILDLRDLPCQVVFIAQDRVFNLEEDDSQIAELDPEVGPRLMPSVASFLNAAVSVIGHTFVRVKTTTKKNDKGKKTTTRSMVYCLRLGPDPVYATKVRSPRDAEVPDFIEDPTYQDILDVIAGEY